MIATTFYHACVLRFAIQMKESDFAVVSRLAGKILFLTKVTVRVVSLAYLFLTILWPAKAPAFRDLVAATYRDLTLD